MRFLTLRKSSSGGGTIGPILTGINSITSATGSTLTLATLDSSANLIFSPHGSGLSYFNSGTGTAGGNIAGGINPQFVNKNYNPGTAGTGLLVGFGAASGDTYVQFMTVGSGGNTLAGNFLFGNPTANQGNVLIGTSTAAYGGIPSTGANLGVVGAGAFGGPLYLASTSGVRFGSSSAGPTAAPSDATGAADFILTNSTTGLLKFGSTTHFADNGAVACALTSVGPTGASTTVQQWLRFKNSTGAVRYVPCF